jgi:hypothetical protein
MASINPCTYISGERDRQKSRQIHDEIYNDTQKYIPTYVFVIEGVTHSLPKAP